jgi:hypothetical protein
MSNGIGSIEDLMGGKKAKKPVVDPNNPSTQQAFQKRMDIFIG